MRDDRKLGDDSEPKNSAGSPPHAKFLERFGAEEVSAGLEPAGGDRMRSSSASTVVCDTVDDKIAICIVFEIFATVYELATRCLREESCGLEEKPSAV